jgi:hypothetical protein
MDNSNMDYLNFSFNDFQPRWVEELAAFPLLAGPATGETAFQRFTAPMNEFVDYEGYLESDQAAQLPFTAPMADLMNFNMEDEKIEDFNTAVNGLLEFDALAAMEDDQAEQQLPSPAATQSPTAPKAAKKRPNRTPCSFAGCEKDFCNAQVMRKHVDSVHNGQKHSCEEPGCDKAFTDDRNLRRHRAKHNVGAVQRECPHCKKSFPAARSDNFKRHVTSTCPIRPGKA